MFFFLMVHFFHVLQNSKNLGDPQGHFYCLCPFIGLFYCGHNIESERTPPVAIEIIFD